MRLSLRSNDSSTLSSLPLPLTLKRYLRDDGLRSLRMKEKRMKIEDENEQHWWWRYLVITKVDYFFLQLCPPYLPNFFFAFSKYSVKPLSSSNKIFSCSTFRWNFQTYRLYLNLYSLILDYLMEVRKSFKFPSLFKSKNKL